MRGARRLAVGGVRWRYYRLGDGDPLLWLTGGLRRAALGEAVLELLAESHTVIAPDYAPIRTLGAFLDAMDAILDRECIGPATVLGQSYGGLLAQAYAAQRPHRVRRLILSSSGPADYGKPWLPLEYLAIGLARVAPEALLKSVLASILGRLAADLSGPQRAELRGRITSTLRQDLTRDDVISHFAVAADIIRTHAVDPAALRRWRGRVVILRADNDPTQRPGDLRRYQRLFGRDVETVGLGQLGHAAAVTDPEAFTAILQQVLDTPE